MAFATRNIMPSAAPKTQAPLQWNMPTPGVSLNYAPQQQVIGDPRNAAVIAAATAPRPVATPAPVSPLARTQPVARRQKNDFRQGSNRSGNPAAGGYAGGRGLY